MGLLNVQIDTSSVEKMISDYEKQLNKRCQVFIGRLSAVGISVSSVNGGHFGSYITYEIQTNPTTTGCTGILIYGSSQLITEEWQLADGSVKSTDVNPLLMQEFGSGPKASNPMNIAGYGRGTFPVGGHGNEPKWSWKDLDGNWHTSTGFKPTAPVQKAYMQMYANIQNIARQVFGS